MIDAKAVGAAITVVLFSMGAAAQTPKPAPAIEVSVGYAGFVDESLIGHALFGGSGRWYLTPRLSVGPEVVYMVGPDADRDLFVTGNVTLDLRRTPPAGRRGVIPYVVVGGGVFQHRDRFGHASFVSHEGAFTGGGGARIWILPDHVRRRRSSCGLGEPHPLQRPSGHHPRRPLEATNLRVRGAW